MCVGAGGWPLASVIELLEKYLGLITKYVNYSTTKTTLNMIQVFKDEKDKYFLDYPNTSTELSFILTSLRLAAEAGLQSPIRNHFDDLH